MKAIVDEDTCIGCGMCIGIAPDIFRFNDDGKSEAFGEVTPENQDDAISAEDSCPVSAITVD